MMHSLLKRQIRKFLKLDPNSEELKSFLDAINKSYEINDEQFGMLQRATNISSEELYEANKRLKKESESQKEVIKKLSRVIDTLKFYGLEGVSSQENQEVSSSTLVDFIDGKTKEIVEINKQKDKLVTNLEQQNQELTDYAHMVSHDLKSPLRAIETLITWLDDDYKELFDENGKDSLIHIKDNVEKMENIITGILEYSDIGRSETLIGDVDLNKEVHQMLSELDCPKNIFITTQNLPTVYGSSYRLQQLFKNIVDNAIKYNDKEKGLIEIGYNEYSKTHYKFFIKDNGKGIEEKHFDKIFKTFSKLENDPKSIGIGLSIVKKIVNLFDGQIWLDSKLNEGTVFYFTLRKKSNNFGRRVS
ncbi:sensor histidine kinase [Flavicella sediminum]|uniref:sensor histidine kinase n=1 Tax=Flavicella sediminum TaxID=2585141 RepID=UPI001FB65EB5|nr:ATP-binding protein [Flavicella sediminum]